MKLPKTILIFLSTTPTITNLGLVNTNAYSLIWNEIWKPGDAWSSSRCFPSSHLSCPCLGPGLSCCQSPSCSQTGFTWLCCPLCKHQHSLVCQASSAVPANKATSCTANWATSLRQLLHPLIATAKSSVSVTQQLLCKNAAPLWYFNSPLICIILFVAFSTQRTVTILSDHLSSVLRLCWGGHSPLSA